MIDFKKKAKEVMERYGFDNVVEHEYDGVVRWDDDELYLLAYCYLPHSDTHAITLNGVITERYLETRVDKPSFTTCDEDIYNGCVDLLERVIKDHYELFVEDKAVDVITEKINKLSDGECIVVCRKDDGYYHIVAGKEGNEIFLTECYYRPIKGQKLPKFNTIGKYFFPVTPKENDQRFTKVTNETLADFYFTVNDNPFPYRYVSRSVDYFKYEEANKIDQHSLEKLSTYIDVSNKLRPVLSYHGTHKGKSGSFVGVRTNSTQCVVIQEDMFNLEYRLTIPQSSVDELLSLFENNAWVEYLSKKGYETIRIGDVEFVRCEFKESRSYVTSVIFPTPSEVLLHYLVSGDGTVYVMNDFIEKSSNDNYTLTESEYLEIGRILEYDYYPPSGKTDKLLRLYLEINNMNH